MNIDKGAFKHVRASGSDAWFGLITNIVRKMLAEHLIESRDEIGAPSLLSVVCDYLTEWTLPGLLLIGDAAHPMSPVGGQGVNVALRDTLVAANYLVPLLAFDAAPDAIDAACKAIQEERGSEVLAIQKLQTAHAKALLARGVKAKLMRAVIPVAMRIPAVRKRTFTGERGFGRLQRPIRLLV
jgi:2-polyprenyl-6-methoxyphenol hydroxylase-like FAD-dependent oxidoreductase